MLSDKNSLILCAIVAVGFAACGIIGILDNYAVIGLLLACFFAIIINIFLVKSKHGNSDRDEEIEPERSSENNL